MSLVRNPLAHLSPSLVLHLFLPHIMSVFCYMSFSLAFLFHNLLLPRQPSFSFSLVLVCSFHSRPLPLLAAPNSFSSFSILSLSLVSLSPSFCHCSFSLSVSPPLSVFPLLSLCRCPWLSSSGIHSKSSSQHSFRFRISNVPSTPVSLQ